jgi:hypothetical protein
MGTFWPSLAQLAPAAYCVGLALSEHVRLDLVAELLLPADRAVMKQSRSYSRAGCVVRGFRILEPRTLK